MRVLLGLLLVGAALVSSGCGGPDQADTDKAKAYCSSTGAYTFNGMGLDPYKDTVGFDRCVDDVLKVVDCIDNSATKGGGGFVPPDCDEGGFLKP